MQLDIFVDVNSNSDTGQSTIVHAILKILETNLSYHRYLIFWRKFLQWNGDLNWFGQKGNTYLKYYCDGICINKIKNLKE